MDPGAGANFISYDVVKRLKLISLKLKDDKVFNRTNIKVCGAANKTACVNISHYARITININNEQQAKTINVLCFIGPFKEELIIGLRDIRRHNLILAAPKLFFSNHSECPTMSSMDDSLLTRNDESTRGLLESVENI